MELNREIGHEYFSAPKEDKNNVKNCKTEERYSGKFLDPSDVEVDELIEILEALELADEYEIDY
jgi:hypothetical protein